MKQQKGKDENNSNLVKQIGWEGRPDSLQAALRTFRDSLHSASERPNEFWARQRAGINKRLGHRISTARWRPALVWASAAMIVLIGYTMFTEKSKTPTFAFAVGYDQNLLIEVERALNKRYPDGLAPAEILSQEIEKGNFKKVSFRK